MRVKLEDGSESTFLVSTAQGPKQWVTEGPGGFYFGNPVLYVRSLDREAVSRAVEEMAADMGGFWLRYYNSAKRQAPQPEIEAVSDKPKGKKAR